MTIMTEDEVRAVRTLGAEEIDRCMRDRDPITPCAIALTTVTASHEEIRAYSIAKLTEVADKFRELDAAVRKTIEWYADEDKYDALRFRYANEPAPAEIDRGALARRCLAKLSALTKEIGR